MMQFDLYGSLPPAAKALTETALTSLDTLDAATWVQIADDRWRLRWTDHCEYPDEGVEDNGKHFVLELYAEDGEWLCDWWHSSRGGPQVRDGVDYEGADVDGAQEAARTAMTHDMIRWIEANAS